MNADGAAPAFVHYSIREVEGGFSRAGVLMWRPGENRLPLDVPHRGLYDLTLRPQNGTELQTRFGIVFEPPAVSPFSRWGMFSIRFDNAARDREMARGHRLVGASWSPKAFALGIRPDAGKDGGSAQAIYAGSSALDHDWHHIAFVYTVSQNDVASDAAFWKIILRVDAQMARSMVLWDDVALRVRAE